MLCVQKKQFALVFRVARRSSLVEKHRFAFIPSENLIFLVKGDTNGSALDNSGKALSRLGRGTGGSEEARSAPGAEPGM